MVMGMKQRNSSSNNNIVLSKSKDNKYNITLSKELLNAKFTSDFCMKKLEVRSKTIILEFKAAELNSINSDFDYCICVEYTDQTAGSIRGRIIIKR